MFQLWKFEMQLSCNKNLWNLASFVIADLVLSSQYHSSLQLVGSLFYSRWNVKWSARICQFIWSWFLDSEKESDSCHKFVSCTQIPGFRPGKKVPETVLINHIGKKNVQKATIESILKRTFPHAMSSVHCSNSSLHLFSFVYTFWLCYEESIF